MMLFCHASPLDASMGLSSLGIVSEDDALQFLASALDDPVVVRQTLRDFIATATEIGNGEMPMVGVEGFNFDEPVPKLVLERAHGLFRNSMGALVRWLDISHGHPVAHPETADALTIARLLRDDFVARRDWRRELRASLSTDADSSLQNNDLSHLRVAHDAIDAEHDGPIGDPAIQAAIVLRDQVLMNEQWWSDADVPTLSVGQRVIAAQFQGRIFIPSFQFLEEALHPRLPDLVKCLPRSGRGWAAVLWCFAPTRKLGGARPADVFATDPSTVIDAARRNFQGDNADW